MRNLDDLHTALVLVAHDVEETRDGIEALLTADGYAFVTARHEDDAVAKARRRRPDLILVSFDGVAVDVILSAGRIRQRAGLGNEVPVVIFCVPIIDEGAEVALGNNVYITRPDNFDQLSHRLAAFSRSRCHQPDSGKTRCLESAEDEREYSPGRTRESADATGFGD